MKMVDNKDEVWLHWSTKALLAVATLQSVWALMPEAWIKTYPAWVTPAVAYSSAVLAGFGIVAKFIKQRLPSDPAP